MSHGCSQESVEQTASVKLLSFPSNPCSYHRILVQRDKLLPHHSNSLLKMEMTSSHVVLSLISIYFLVMSFFSFWYLEPKRRTLWPKQMETANGGSFGFSWPSLAYTPDRAYSRVHKGADTIEPSSFLNHDYQINGRILQVWLDDWRTSTKHSVFVFL